MSLPKGCKALTEKSPSFLTWGKKKDKSTQPMKRKSAFPRKKNHDATLMDWGRFHQKRGCPLPSGRKFSQQVRKREASVSLPEKRSQPLRPPKEEGEENASKNRKEQM